MALMNHLSVGVHTVSAASAWKASSNSGRLGSAGSLNVGRVAPMNPWSVGVHNLSAASAWKASSSAGRLGSAGCLNVGRVAWRAEVGAVRCGQKKGQEAEEQQRGVNRREILRVGSGIVLGSALLSWAPFPPEDGAANAADIAQRFQRGEFAGKVKDTLRDAVSGNRELVPDLLRLALNDALTYDKVTKSGGANGSVRFELGRPENAGLGPAVKFLEGVKADLDGKLTKSGPISWADLIILAAQSATKRTFISAATQKCGGNEEKGLQLYAAYGSPGQWGYFDKLLGRADATGPDPEGRVLVWDKASPSEISARFADIGIKPRYVTALSAFLGHDQLELESKLSADQEYAPYVRKYQESRRTVSRAEYEVDLITTFSKISVLGQAINYEAYTYKGPSVKF